MARTVTDIVAYANHQLEELLCMLDGRQSHSASCSVVGLQATPALNYMPLFKMILVILEGSLEIHW